jgi:D-serine deaminase-like pyridoxal phosphate-dependent protein
MKLSDLTTPCALVERSIVEANTARMRARADQLGVRLRPHVKTHKTLQGARLQLGAEVGPIAVSTLAEAHQFAAWGFDDITYAVPIAPARVRELLPLAQRGCRLGVILDSAEVLAALDALGARSGLVIPAYLKLDCGYHRAGVQPEDPAGFTLARAMSESKAVEFRGILAHAGHSYTCADPTEILAVAEAERQVSVDYAQRLAEAGIEVPEISIGSTPTAAVARNLEGITEIRPGNYVFYDCFQAAIGSCALTDVAFSVLTTIIGSYPERSTLIIDAGALALSKDAGATHLGEPAVGFGRVCDPGSGEPVEGLALISLSQEHGHVDVGPGVPWEVLRVGDKLRILPNHSCLTAALHERYWLVDAQRAVEDWEPVRGW